MAYTAFMNSIKNFFAGQWIGPARAVCYAAIVFVNYTLDRATKLLAVRFLKNAEPIQLLDRFMILVYIENDGAFLGMGQNWPMPIKRITFIIIPLLICLAGLVYAYRKTTGTPQAIAALFLIGGGLGNLQDRILNNGLVIDFMNFGIGGLRTGILNVSDLSVTAGALALMVFSIRDGKGRIRDT
jgi:signal peptidase II